MYAEKQTGKYTTRFTRLPTAVQANRHHLSRHPPAARYLFGPMVQCAASAIAAQCIGHCSAVHRPLQRAAISFAAQCVWHTTLIPCLRHSALGWLPASPNCTHRQLPSPTFPAQCGSTHLQASPTTAPVLPCNAHRQVHSTTPQATEKPRRHTDGAWLTGL